MKSFMFAHFPTYSPIFLFFSFSPVSLFCPFSLFPLLSRFFWLHFRGVWDGGENCVRLVFRACIRTMSTLCVAGWQKGRQRQEWQSRGPIGQSPVSGSSWPVECWRKKPSRVYQISADLNCYPSPSPSVLSLYPSQAWCSAPLVQGALVANIERAAGLLQ